MKPTISHSRNSLIFAVALPPPIHGQSLANFALLERFGGDDDVRIANIAPVARKARSFQYHLSRLIRVVGALSPLLRNAGKEKKTAYFVFESGLGVVYNLFLILIAQILGYQLILHHHTARHTLAYSRRFAVLNKTLHKSCVHVVLSKKMQSDLVAQYGVKSTYVCPNASIVASFKPPISSRTISGKVVLGMLSNLTVEKGVSEAIATFRILKHKNIECELHFAGPINDALSQSLIRAAQAEFGVCLKYYGPLSGAEKQAFYSVVDIFLFASRYKYEAQPLVLLEAMSQGIPIIASSAGYIKEMIQDDSRVLSNLADFPNAASQKIIEWVFTPSKYLEVSVATRLSFERQQFDSITALNGLVSMLKQ